MRPGEIAMMPEMETADSFLILDVDSGNSLCAFEGFEEAAHVLSEMAGAMPHRADSIALVAFDKSGFALDTVFPSDLGSAPAFT